MFFKKHLGGPLLPLVQWWLRPDNILCPKLLIYKENETFLRTCCNILTIELT